MRWEVHGKLKAHVDISRMSEDLIQHISFEKCKIHDTHESADEERQQLEQGIYADRVDYYLVIMN